MNEFHAKMLREATDERDRIEDEIAELHVRMAEVESIIDLLTGEIPPTVLKRKNKPRVYVTDEQVRDWIVKHPEFTVREMADALDINSKTAATKLIPFKEKGIVKVTDHKNRGERYHVYVPPTDPGPPNPLPPKEEVPVVAAPVTTTPVPHTGGRLRTGNKRLDTILTLVRRQGGTVTRGSGHIKVTPKGEGKVVTISSTPTSDDTLEAIERDLKEAGFRL